MNDTARNMGESSTESLGTFEIYSSVQHVVNTMELLRRDQKYCDAVIEAGGKKFKIHKSVFAIYSDYFDNVSAVEMQEGSNDVVKLEDTRCDVMKCIVDFIYTGELSINRENAIELIVTANHLRIEKLENLGVNYLLHRVDTENCVSVWLCAKTHNLEELLDKSLTIFRKNLLSISREDLNFLTNEQFIEIMESSKALEESEEASFIVTATWAKCDLEKRKGTFCEMLPSFKWNLFSKDSLKDIANDESLPSISMEIWQQVVIELVARLDKANEEEEEACRKIGELERENRNLANQVVSLTEENKRITECAQENVINSWQATEQRQKDSETSINDLIEENKLLKKHVEEYQTKVENKKEQQEALISMFVKKEKGLTRSLNLFKLCKQVLLKHTQYLIHRIRLVLNNPAKLSVIQKRVLLSEDDVKFINEQLEQIVYDLEQY